MKENAYKCLLLISAQYSVVLMFHVYLPVFLLVDIGHLSDILVFLDL